MTFTADELPTLTAACADPSNSEAQELLIVRGTPFGPNFQRRSPLLRWKCASIWNNMSEKPSRNTDVAGTSGDDSFSDLRQLSDRELEQLRALLHEPSHPSARDLLAFGGARTVAGLVARLVVADPEDRAILLTAIRRAIRNAGLPSES